MTVLQSEDPFIVRLLFEPSGRPDSQQDYYLTAKENLCVVCGKADSYIRFDFIIYPLRLNQQLMMPMPHKNAALSLIVFFLFFIFY